MLASLLLCVAIIQADPSSAQNGGRFQSPSPLIDKKDYRPTVEYVPHVTERRKSSVSTPSSTRVSTVPYELVAHSVVSHSQHRTTAMRASAFKPVSRATPPKLHASFEIPVPDDLTKIQSKEDPASRETKVVCNSRKTASPRIERILGIDSAHLSATSSGSSSPQRVVNAPMSEEIPVPTIGS